MADAAPSTTMPRVGNGTLTLYSLGAVSSGIKLKILETFLLIFYNQAIGLPPAAVSSVILIATVFDTVTDPVVGWYSDRLRTPLGRRHPLMYGAALPLAIAFFLLWNPPISFGHTATYVWMIASYLVVRFGYSLYENSSKALAPELVTDYDRRTTLVSLRIFFRTLAGLGATVLAYQYFLKVAPDGTGGVTDRNGYFAFALFCSVVILVVILISARATQWIVPWLSKPARDGGGPWRAFGEMFGMLRNRSALAILSVGMLVSISSGVRNGLELYFGLYFWGLSQHQLSGIATMTAIATFAGAALVPVVARNMGKREAALAAFTLAVLFAGLPILLRLIGLMPANGTMALYAILMADIFVSGVLYVMTAVLLNSMLADVTDELAVATGRRSEGLLFAADGFFTKAVSGFGVMISGGLLAFIAFPAHAHAATVPAATLWWLGALYLPIVILVNAAAIAMVWMFRIDRHRHEENLRTLAEDAAKRTAEPAPSALT
ncbi:MFS transporter [Sphingomonas sp. MMSM20]|uniref:MFS transporter n=1 Tax=Sphingomonas lycopersici TaxID=2951807 RepID=UPI002238F785|nr:MFS transporter [Sphingomonas lycopersici]MCW6530284.1 MFS transporter [Sphingomonas lycopersici]